MNQHDLYIQTIDSIPSDTMREYLTQHPVELSIMQMATVISYFSDSARTARLFRSLAKNAQSPDEKALLRSAIKDLKTDRNIGERTQSLYEKTFSHEGPPFFPFLERCRFPVLFKENDVIQCDGVTYTVKSAPVINDNCDFSDECYLCSPVAFYPECGAAHCHIHVCEAEKLADNGQDHKTVYESIVQGLHEAIYYENGIGEARVDFVQLRHDMNELDDLAEKAGGYVAFFESNDIHYDFRRINAYCKERGIEPADMTIRELGQFIKHKSNQ